MNTKQHKRTLFYLFIALTVIVIPLTNKLLYRFLIKNSKIQTIKTPFVQKSQLETWPVSYNYTLVQQSLAKRNYSISSLPPKSALWTDNIHLCINFNLNNMSPSKRAIDILSGYYYPFFSNITFILNDVTEIPHFMPDYIDSIACSGQNGWYQHKCLIMCMQRGSPDTKGFLYIADDMFVNFTKMSQLPTTKLWFVPLQGSTKAHPASDKWVWWGPPNNFAQKLKIVVKILPTEWKNQLKAIDNFPQNFQVHAISDIVYVPTSLVSNMTAVLSHIINTTDLFCEVAIPLAVSLVAPERVTLMDGFMGEVRSIALAKSMANTKHFIHSLKLSKKEYAELWIEYMEKQLYNIVC